MRDVQGPARWYGGALVVALFIAECTLFEMVYKGASLCAEDHDGVSTTKLKNNRPPSLTDAARACME